MKNILDKILNLNKISKNVSHFQELKKTTKVVNIFKAISNFSKKSEIRYVGGCIRKILNNEIVDDIDLATNLNPEEVKKVLKNNNINFFETGLDHGTITAEIEGKKFEITSLRKDVDTDGRHAIVEFSNDWHEDASRRDFTINSIYSDLEGNLYDPHSGKNDLENGKIKFIGDADKRIKEDYLRILRYVRFFLNYSKCDHEPNIKKIIRRNINGIKNISTERLLDELKKIVLSNGFLKINEDEFINEIITLIFPQLKNVIIFKNLNNYAKEKFKSGDFIFLLSLMIIDEKDNADYFLYKFNISNEEKKRIKFLNGIFSKPLDKKTFSEDNLWKIFYFNNKNYLFDMIDFQIFKLKKTDERLLKLKNFFKNKNKPLLPIKATQLMEKYNLKEGKILGEKLKKIENIWLNNQFKISTLEIDKIIKD